MRETLLLDIGQLASKTGLPMAWIKRESEQGRIPSILAGKRRFYDLEAVMTALLNTQNTRASK